MKVSSFFISVRTVAVCEQFLAHCSMESCCSAVIVVPFIVFKLQRCYFKYVQLSFPQTKYLFIVFTAHGYLAMYKHWVVILRVL